MSSNQYRSAKPYSGTSSRDTLVLDLIRNGQAQQKHDESHFQASHSQQVECNWTRSTIDISLITWIGSWRRVMSSYSSQWICRQYDSRCTPSRPKMSSLSWNTSVHFSSRSTYPKCKASHFQVFHLSKYPNREEEEFQKQCAKSNLERWVIYVLRQLDAKRTRRKKQREIVGKSHERPGASGKWLAEKCSAHLHQWTRLYWNRQGCSTVQQCDRSISPFIDFLKERKDIFQLTDEDNHQKRLLSEKN